MRSRQYGPIYKETIGNLTSVIISDLDEYAKVIHVDGRYPNRIEMEPLAHYRRKRNMGFSTADGSVTNQLIDSLPRRPKSKCRQVDVDFCP